MFVTKGEFPQGLEPAKKDKELNGTPFGKLRAGSKGVPLQNALQTGFSRDP